MSAKTSMKELRNMQVSDLQAEAKELGAKIAAVRLGIEMRSHKDTSSHKRLHKELARTLTALNEKRKTSTMPASAKALADKTVPSKQS